MLRGLDPTRIAGRYDVEGIAGSGGLGVVYRCRDRETNEIVAVKVAPRTSIKHRERFMREAEMLSTIRHPNVVRYLGHGMLETEQPWLAMEWLEGEDLHARLERAPLTLPESIALARHLAGALGAAHTAGIVHRDVKPANVFLVGKDATKPKLIDFGIARAARAPHAAGWIDRNARIHGARASARRAAHRSARGRFFARVRALRVLERAARVRR
jgi:serine/threonine protein kinase